jgi:hypothetical protein
MTIDASGNGRGRTAMEFEATPRSDLASEYYWAAPESAYPSKPEREFERWQTLRGAGKTAERLVPLARYLAPIAFRVSIDAVSGARAGLNPLTAQLLHPLLLQGDRHSRWKEAEFFGELTAELEVANRAFAREAALTEVLAAEASHTPSESEAAALIGAILPLAFRVMQGQHLLRPVLPVLLIVTARLVRFLHGYSPGSRRLLRLVPAILRRTIASLVAARRWGCPMRAALVGCVMAAQTRRVLESAPSVRRAIARNALIRVSTVAAVPRSSGVWSKSRDGRLF